MSSFSHPSSIIDENIKTAAGEIGDFLCSVLGESSVEEAGSIGTCTDLDTRNIGDITHGGVNRAVETMVVRRGQTGGTIE